MKTIKKYPDKTLYLITIYFIALSFLAGCSKSSDMNPAPGQGQGPGANEINIQNMAFSPQTLTISVNTTVKWTNKDAVSHTVTSTSGLFDSGSISTGGTFSFQFSTAGTFNYFCSIHPAMTGKIIVQ